MKIIIICLLVFSVSLASAIVGKVVGVHDGDSLPLLTSDNKQLKIRLLGIDAPELKQAYGTKAKQALSSKVYGKQIEIRNTSLDRYKRTLADVYIDGRWINIEMVQEGWAWRYLYTKDKRISAAEETAKLEQVGLWADPSPVAPWDYRKK